MAQSVYEKVTTAPTDWSGTYLIVCESEAVVFNGAADEESIDAKGGAAILTNVSIANNQILGTEALDAAVFTISSSEDTDWPWAIQSASGLYIGHKDTVDNGLSTETEIKGKCKHVLSIDEAGNFIAMPKYSVSGEYNLQYNKKADQLRFRYFTPGDKVAIQLYKKQSASTSLDAVQTSTHVIKRYENGQIVFIKGNDKYNVLGKKL